jgi:asparagine synthase (glutamine-hydrolysing)
MCGLAGVIALNGGRVDPTLVKRMAASLRHRGPDDAGIFIEGAVGLGFRRLAILDLSPSGHQPMISQDGRYILVYNGEIYNYIELREELQALGYLFRSSGDSEVLLNAYSAWGKDCLQKFNGMWAFLVYDRQRQALFGSRDRFGVKPLYRCISGDLVLFASEIKAILSSGRFPVAVNWRTTAKFFKERNLDGTDETFFSGISQIRAGTAFELGVDGKWSEWRYWSLSDLSPVSADHAPTRFLELFEDAVRLRLRSDVPVGVSLSGGLDSTSVICSMARQRRRQFNGSVGPLAAFAYITPEFDESSYIQDTLAQTGAELFHVPIDARELVEELEKFLWFHDEPVYTMYALIGFQIMKSAAQHGVKVMLGGQGADESIGGYFNYFEHYWSTVLATEGLAEVRREIDDFVRVHGGAAGNLLKDVLVRACKAKLRYLPAYRALARWKREREAGKSNDWFTPELLKSLPIEDVNPDQSLDTALRLSIERSNLPHYLRIEDRNSMAHSVEMRLPFMDYRMISYVLKLPASWKMRGPWNKYVLREAMRGKIPESIRTRPDKMGFSFPAQKWLREGLDKAVLELLGTREMRERGVYDIAAIKRDLGQQTENNPDLPFKVFDVLQFELWCRLAKKYSEQSFVASVADVDCGNDVNPQSADFRVG